jgi:hypothetical protein
MPSATQTACSRPRKPINTMAMESMAAITVDVVCIRHDLDSQDECKLLSHCCKECRDQHGEGNLEGELDVGFTRTEVEPALILCFLMLRLVSMKVCLGTVFGRRGTVNNGG